MIKITELNFETSKDFDLALTSVKVKFRFPKLRDRFIFVFKCLTQYEIEESGSFMAKKPTYGLESFMKYQDDL